MKFVHHTLHLAAVILVGLFASQGIAQDSLHVAQTEVKNLFWDAIHDPMIFGENLVVPTGSSGFSLYDVDDLSNPDELATILGDYTDLKPFGEYLLAAGRDGLRVYSYTPPASFELVSFVERAPRNKNTILPLDTGCYTLDGSGNLQWIDLEDPANPVSSGTDLRVDHTVVNDSLMICIDFTTLFIYNIEERDTPVLLSTIDLGTFRNSNPVLHEDRLFFCQSSQLVIYDISDPSAPMLEANLIRECDVEGEIVLEGDTLYHFSGYDLVILDMSDLIDVQEIVRLELGYMRGGRRSILKHESQLAISTSEELWLYDCTDLTQPTFRSSMDKSDIITDLQQNDTYNILQSSSGEVLFYSLATSYLDPYATHYFGGEFMSILDTIGVFCSDYDYDYSISNLSNPLDITHLGSFSASQDFIRTVSAQYPRIGLINNAGTGLLVDISQPTSPHNQGEFSYSSNPVASSFSGPYLTVGREENFDYGDSHQTFDVTDPDNPVAVSYSEVYRSNGLSVTHLDTVLIYDALLHEFQVYIPDPPYATMISSYERPEVGDLISLSMRGSYLFASDADSGLTIYDARSLLDPVPVAYHRSPAEQIHFVQMGSDHILATSPYSLMSFTHTLPPIPPCPDLLEPADGTILEYEGLDILDFGWGSSIQEGMETAEYRLWLHLTHDDGDTTFQLYQGPDTSFQVDLLELLGDPFPPNWQAAWWVEASAESVRSQIEQCFSFSTDYVNDLEDAAISPLPDHFTVDPIHPNPFNASTVVNVHLPTAGSLDMRLYDILGREAWAYTASRSIAGSHAVQIDGSILPSGIYFLRTRWNHAVSNQQKVVVIK